MPRSATSHHPAVKLAAYLLLPVSLDIVSAKYLAYLQPDWSLFIVRGSGMLIAVSWGWAGLLCCVMVGILLGLPVAGLHIAFLRDRLAQLRDGSDVSRVLDGTDSLIITVVPWFLMAAIGYVVGFFWLFPPLGGPLLAVNVLWPRTLVYHHQLWVYEYQKAYGKQQRHPAATPATS